MTDEFWHIISHKFLVFGNSVCQFKRFRCFMIGNFLKSPNGTENYLICKVGWLVIGIKADYLTGDLGL